MMGLEAKSTSCTLLDARSLEAFTPLHLDVDTTKQPGEEGRRRGPERLRDSASPPLVFYVL